MLLLVVSFAVILGILVVLSFLVASAHVQLAASRPTAARPKLAPRGDGLPPIPRSVREVLATLDAEKFELFSAAVVMGLGQGYTFKEHCGGSGDHGIDVKLRNAYGMRVGVQSKFYTPGNTVGSDEVREFLGSLTFYNAIHGFFVTTSTFTPAARQVIESTHGYIRAIDGPQLDTYLRWQSREIALAWREVQELEKSMSIT